MGKTILMFCTDFFGYEKRIADGLRAAGHRVDLYDERPSGSALAKLCIRKNVRLYRPHIRRYVEQIIQKNRAQRYDIILVVKGEAVNAEIISMLRQTWPNAEYILYLWDALKNIPEGETRISLYDRVFTFDPADAKQYDLPLLLLPYSAEHAGTAAAERYEYDIAFVGTAHSDRPQVVSEVKNFCEAHGLRCFVYLYSPHIFVYLFNKLTNPSYRGIRRRDVHFSPLPDQALYKIYSASKCVLDIEHPGQSGATTRAVEMLPLRRKVITTNPLVRTFPFYREENYHVIDRKRPEIDLNFLKTEYVPLPEEIIAQYSPKQFAMALLA